MGLVEHDVATLKERVDAHGREIDEMRINVVEIRSDVKQIKDMLDTIKATIDEQARVPANRWNDLVKQVIAIIVAALVGLALVRAGIS